MSILVKARLLSDFGKGDTVRTPSKRLALVRGHHASHVLLSYLDDADELMLSPRYITLVKRAAPHQFPAKFFGDAKKAKGE